MQNYEWYRAESVGNLRELILRSARKFGERDAFCKKSKDGTIDKKSFRDVAKDMNAFGCALYDMGIRNSHIAILGENSYEWVISYLAAVNGCGVAVPIDKDLSGEEIEGILRCSDVDVLICSKTCTAAAQVALHRLGRPVFFIVTGMEGQPCEDGAMTFERLMRRGRELSEKGYDEFQHCRLEPDEMRVILNTSGTTGHSKGVMLSQRNIISVILAGIRSIKTLSRTLSVLPIHHTFECHCCILIGIYAGITTCFNDSLKYLQDNLVIFRPDMLAVVPLFLETMWRKINDALKKENKEELFHAMVRLSNRLRRRGIDVRRILFRRILRQFGGNLRIIMSGGAPLRPELVDAYDEIGILILNGYGITECSPLVTVSRNRYYARDAVGVVIPCCEVKVDNPDKGGNGEILVRGDNVMLGYYKDPEETARAMEGGWFHTGDIGQLDESGFLHITGRKKNTIILSNGENVQPEELEFCLTTKIPYIKEVVVCAMPDERGNEQISAIVVLDGDRMDSFGIKDAENQLRHDIRAINKALPTYKQIGCIRIKKEDFEKTTTKKIKRFKIREEELSYVGTA